MTTNNLMISAICCWYTDCCTGLPLVAALLGFAVQRCPPYAVSFSRGLFLTVVSYYCSSLQVTREELEAAATCVGKFGSDNRAGIPGTLHRISALRSRKGSVVGLTCRVGRAVSGNVGIIQDVLAGEVMCGAAGTETGRCRQRDGWLIWEADGGQASMSGIQPMGASWTFRWRDFVPGCDWATWCDWGTWCHMGHMA